MSYRTCFTKHFTLRTKTSWSISINSHDGTRTLNAFHISDPWRHLKILQMRNILHSIKHWIHTDPSIPWEASFIDVLNSLRPIKDGHYFPDDIFKWIFLNENVWISIKISLKCVPKGPIYSIPALVKIMAWHWPGNKPLSEPMINSLLAHIWVTQHRWVKQNQVNADDAS